MEFILFVVLVAMLQVEVGWIKCRREISGEEGLVPGETFIFRSTFIRRFSKLTFFLQKTMLILRKYDKHSVNILASR